ncbi:hypothetical protein Dd703_3960 [Musicola paradisiaca Ech703]|uniref:Uncharacterized protein n=1 Tax=Musicola paradisiaca (strain Ech703) TaxID=579405 RepID=C6C6A4_MUSP7|nr:hypothetical protein Dd703_3960 [Musicola paradisiaca Ech703]
MMPMLPSAKRFFFMFIFVAVETFQPIFGWAFFSTQHLTVAT